MKKRKERNVEKKSKVVNCQIGISFVLWPSSLEQLIKFIGVFQHLVP